MRGEQVRTRDLFNNVSTGDGGQASWTQPNFMLRASAAIWRIKSDVVAMGAGSENGRCEQEQETST